MRHARVACLAALVLLGSTGCSWFRAKPGSADGSAAAVPATDASASTSGAEAAASIPPAGAPAAEAGEPAQGPVAVAMDFLAMHKRFGNSGLPSRADMGAYDAFLCPSLAQAVRAAQVRQEVAKAERPDEKPPYVEGDLFSSLFEGPDEFEARDSVVEGDRARVQIAMSTGSGEQARRWTDTLELRLDEGIWCLDDVAYGGDWPFANKGRLGAVLAPR
jgi:hypothetical protein